MRFTRLRIRTLLVATASVAIGYGAVLNYVAYMNADRLGPIPRDPAAEFTRPRPLSPLALMLPCWDCSRSSHA